MDDLVQCADCKTVLDEDRTSPRKPCPVCGSTARIFHVYASATAVGEATLRAEGTVSSAAERVFASAGLVLQAVVSPGEKTDEGRLITAVTVPWFEIVELLKKDPTLAFKIPPRKWEEIIAGAYKRAGFDEVTLTPPSKDRGRDVIAVKRDGGVLIGTVRIIEQVKAYAPDHLVTANDVRALMGVLSGEPASKGVLTTTSDFAPQLTSDPIIAPFVPYRVELVNGLELLKRLGRLLTDPSLGPNPHSKGGKWK